MTLSDIQNSLLNITNYLHLVIVETIREIDDDEYDFSSYIITKTLNYKTMTHKYRIELYSTYDQFSDEHNTKPDHKNKIRVLENLNLYEIDLFFRLVLKQKNLTLACVDADEEYSEYGYLIHTGYGEEL